MALEIVNKYLGSPFQPISFVRGQFVRSQLVRGQFVAVSCRGYYTFKIYYTLPEKFHNSSMQ